MHGGGRFFEVIMIPQRIFLALSGASGSIYGLRLAEELVVGTRDLRKIEVVGMQISDALYPYRKS